MIKDPEIMLRIFTKNQLLLNPNYEGEIISLNGRDYDTTKYCNLYRKKYNVPDGDGILELILAFLVNNNSLGLQNTEKKLLLKDMFVQFKTSLPVKYQAEDLLVKMEPNILPIINKYVVKSHNGDVGVYDSALILDNFDKSYITEALHHLFGLSDTRFIFNFLKQVPNGNLLDLSDVNYYKLVSLKKTNPSTYCNLIRSLGYPYSDYRTYIEYGILVSIDINNNVYVIRDSELYCCTEQKLLTLLDGTDFDFWSKSFSKFFSIQDLSAGRKINLELIR